MISTIFIFIGESQPIVLTDYKVYSFLREGDKLVLLYDQILCCYHPLPVYQYIYGTLSQLYRLLGMKLVPIVHEMLKKIN